MNTNLLKFCFCWISLILVPFLGGGCQSAAQTGALIGSAIGTGVGALASSGCSGEAMMIGAGAGGAIGYGIGNEIDKFHAAKERQSIREDMERIRRRASTVKVYVLSNRSYSIVELQRHCAGGGYFGPRGEYYYKLPTRRQLGKIYGW